MNMKVALQLLLLSTVILVDISYSGHINNDICLNMISEPGGPPFPTIPNSFQAKLTWSMLTVNQTWYMEEIFSDELNVGTITITGMLDTGIRSKFYSFPSTKEFIQIDDYDTGYGAECYVSNLTLNDFAYPFTRVKGIENLVSGKDVLFLGATSGTTAYYRQDQIDEIDVDIWRGCLYDYNTDMTYNATFYFTVNTTDPKTDWKTASGIQSAIKRIEMLGGTSVDASPRVHYVYEYAYFDDVIPMDNPQDLANYAPPLGSYCKGRKLTKKMPKLSDIFSFYMEVYDPQQDLIIYTDEYYDFTNNLTRMDRDDAQNRDFNVLPVKVVHDFETGLEYYIEKYTGGCVISPIQSGQYDDVTTGEGSSKVRMRNPKEFFDFDDNTDYPWTYEGNFVVRGVDCDVWISFRPYPTRSGDKMAYWEWYFTSNDWTESNGDVVENLEPFRLVVTIPKENNKQLQFNVYKFNQEEPDDKYFDVSECFDQQNQSRTYQFILRADVAKYNLDGNVNTLRYYVAASLEAFTGVRITRIHNIEFIFDVKKVYVSFALTGKSNINGSVPFPINETSLDDAEMLLRTAIAMEDFLVYYIGKDSQPGQFQVYNNSLQRLETKSKSVYYVIDDDGQDNAYKTKIVPQAVSSGGAAAIAICLLIAGVLLVVIPYYFLAVNKKNNMASYNKTRLTMVEVQE